jgi:hypothetical protein
VPGRIWRPWWPAPARRPLRRKAARELARWEANRGCAAGAQRALELLNSPRREKPSGPTCAKWRFWRPTATGSLGNLRQGARRSSGNWRWKPHGDLYLTLANYEPELPARLEWINRALAHYHISPVTCTPLPGQAPFDGLGPGPGIRAGSAGGDGPLVSILMPAYNAADTLGTALGSLLGQTWGRLEILVVDDCSTDGTAAVVEELSRRDARVRLVRAPANRGAYVARNLGLQEATGDLVMVHDADDWSHPEKIEFQVRQLQAHPELIGVMTEQARTAADLTFHRGKNAGMLIFKFTTSFLFRRQPVLEKAGFWDCVRFGADNEYLRRIKKVFGNHAVANLASGPLSFYRKTETSLTGNDFFGMTGSYMGARKEYFEAQVHCHDSGRDLRFPFPQPVRPFPVPEPMWPIREAKTAEGRRRFDVVIASDFRMVGGSTMSNLEEIKVQQALGLRTGLVQMARYDLDPQRPVIGPVRDLLDGDRVQMLVYGEQIECDLLIVRYPPVLQEQQDYLPGIHAKQVCVIVNQTPLSDYGPAPVLRYEIPKCRRHLLQYFGQAGIWCPIGPQARAALHEHHAADLAAIELSPDDWVNIIDTAAWRRAARPPRGPQIRIGRHSRDHATKWPGELPELLAVYPDADEFEVRILGGAKCPQEVLGYRPRNWQVQAFGEQSPQDFLAGLDVFVYYTHPGLVESFGRVVLEAMAAGVPAVVSPRFKELFGEAVLYAEPQDVQAQVRRLMADDVFYERQVAQACQYVDEHFGYAQHARRLQAHGVTVPH